MAHPGTGGDRPSGFVGRIAHLSALSKRTGVALVVAALPATVVTFAAGALAGPIPPVRWVAGALAHPATTPGGVAWAFHVAVLAGLLGVWLTGAALVAEGAVNVE